MKLTQKYFNEMSEKEQEELISDTRERLKHILDVYEFNYAYSKVWLFSRAPCKQACLDYITQTIEESEEIIEKLKPIYKKIKEARIWNL